jgi:hypothetical protein
LLPGVDHQEVVTQAEQTESLGSANYISRHPAKKPFGRVSWFAASTLAVVGKRDPLSIIGQNGLLERSADTGWKYTVC